MSPLALHMRPRSCRMYERLIWSRLQVCRRPVQAFARLVLRICGACLRFAPSVTRRLARLFSFRFRAVAEAFAAIPPDQLNRCVLFLALKPHTREAKLAEAARLAGWQPMLVYAGDIKFDASRFFQFHARVGGLLNLLLVGWLFPGPLI